MEEKLPNKFDLFRGLLARSSVFVHFDGRNCLYLPEHLRHKDHVVLQFGLDMPVPIPDLYSDETVVSGTLSFKGKPEYVRVPWYLVFALVDESGKGMMYPEDMPEIVRLSLNKPVFSVHEGSKTSRNFDKKLVDTKKRPNHLRLVK